MKYPFSFEDVSSLYPSVLSPPRPVFLGQNQVSAIPYPLGSSQLSALEPA